MWRACARPAWSRVRQAPVEQHTWGGAQLHLTAVYLCVYRIPGALPAAGYASVVSVWRGKHEVHLEPLAHECHSQREFPQRRRGGRVEPPPVAVFVLWVVGRRAAGSPCGAIPPGGAAAASAYHSTCHSCL